MDTHHGGGSGASHRDFFDGERIGDVVGIRAAPFLGHDHAEQTQLPHPDHGVVRDPAVFLPLGCIWQARFARSLAPYHGSCSVLPCRSPLAALRFHTASGSRRLGKIVLNPALRLLIWAWRGQAPRPPDSHANRYGHPPEQLSTKDEGWSTEDALSLRRFVDATQLRRAPPVANARKPSASPGCDNRSLDVFAGVNLRLVCPELRENCIVVLSQHAQALGVQHPQTRVSGHRSFAFP